MQGALPPAPPASPRNSSGASPCQAINFDIFRHIERGDGKAKDKQIADLQSENSSLRGQIRSLTAQMDEIKAELWERINNLTDKLKGAYTSLTNIVKAVGMLKYDKEDGYKVPDLTQKQEKLIDGIAEYGAKWAKEDGFPDMAEDMEKHIGISKGIADTIEPPRRQISRGWDMEL